MKAAPTAVRARQRLERVIESAIGLLDALDGDPDLEEDNEDACAAEDMAPGGRDTWYPGDPDDGEAETDLGALEDEITPGMYRGDHGPGCAVFDGI
jgi:hypothetical protein